LSVLSDGRYTLPGSSTVRLWETGSGTLCAACCPGGVTFALREAIEEGIVRGPRMLCSGAMIVMTGGHCHTLGVEVDGPVEARRAARQQLKEGADFVKLLATGGSTGFVTTNPGRHN
jgi:imidazolonepropionase-like amidohydrolase